MKFIPLQDFVLVQELKGEEITAVGIVIPEDVDKEKNQGTIIAKGDKCALPVDNGDKVLFRSYGFDEVEIEGNKYLVGKEENIIGKLG